MTMLDRMRRHRNWLKWSLALVVLTFIMAIPWQHEYGRFIGEARYEQLLRLQRPPLTKSQFEERYRRGIMSERLRAAITDWMAISDKELENEYRKRNEKVKLQVVAF